MTTVAVPKRRIFGWISFDWASQPYYTLGLTFIFGPYFALVATNYYAGTGLEADAAKAEAQSIWALGQGVAGILIALTAPFLGAFADNTGRKRPWIMLFSVFYVIGAASLWYMQPDSTQLILFLILFYLGFIAAESALNFVNGYLPTLGNDKQVSTISGLGASFGYWGGLVALFIMLGLFSENGDTGLTLLGAPPALGLDAAAKEGTRFVGPFMAVWYILFMIPFFLFVKDDTANARPIPPIKEVTADLIQTLKNVWQRKSTANFLIGSMFYRDALNALYAFGGVYATLVLEWTTVWLGAFGVVSVISAAVFTFLGGLFDRRFGPKPVIITCIILLMIVSACIIGMSREQFFGVPLEEGSMLPDFILFGCGCVIGGAGGALYAASRSMMVRHADPERPTEAFGLFALSGKATAFLAPLLIALFASLTGSVQLSFLPVIFLFLMGLFLLRWVNPEGDRSA